MKKVSDGEFAAKIDGIRARYETDIKADKKNEIDWNTLFVSFFPILQIISNG